MPVEIRELNIRVNLTDSGGNQNATPSTSSESGSSGEAQEALVEAVVEKVLEILKDKMER